MSALANRFLVLGIFSMAFGFLESSVVVYLREIYYPEGFDFPMVPIDKDIGITEFFRELATMIMLLTAGLITGKNGPQKFGFFLYTFAVWDIFYYIWLKAILGWPPSLLTPDILFLVPAPWVGPVITPILIALEMIALSVVLAKLNPHETRIPLSLRDWSILITGAIVVIVAFIWDYAAFVLERASFKAIWTLNLTDPEAMKLTGQYVPEDFNWPLFLLGFLIIGLGIVLYANKNRELL